MPLRGPGPGKLITSPIASPVASFSAVVSVKKWFTTVREVSDLYFGIVGSSDIQDEEVLILGNRENYLKNGNIQVDSERVKEVREFVEGVEFEINYKDGKIKRLQGGGTPGDASSTGAGTGSSVAEFSCSVSVSQVVKVYYDYFTDYIKGTDYQINYKLGTLSRLSEGNIQNGERVFVDYRVISNIGDQIIVSVINQAHKFIMNRIDESLEGTENEDLKYAETYFALGLLANSSASDMLEAKRNNNVSRAAETMLKLASIYEEKAWEFLAPYTVITSPRKSGAKIGKNLS